MKKFYSFLLVFIALSGTSLAQNVTLTATGGTTTGSYTTLKAAFDAINAGTHQGAIVISINSNTSEGSTPATLNSSDADPTSYTSVTIQPSVDNVSISGTPPSGFGIIQLKGADNVTIDGDNPNTAGINRNLTVSISGTANAYNSVIRIATATLVNSAENITIANLNINGNVTSGTTSTTATGTSNTTFGIYAGGNGGSTVSDAPTAITDTTLNVAPSGTTINELVINNCAINQVGRGIVFNGAASSVSTSVTVTSNTIGQSGSSPTTTVYTKGIWIAGTNTIKITDNLIYNIISAITTSLSAIELSSNIGSGTLNIANNTISGMSGTSTGAARTIGISIGAASGVYTVSNNTISAITGGGTSNYSVSGIQVIGATGSEGSFSSNNISGIYNSNTSGYGASGISFVNSVADGSTVQNNFISNVLNAGASSFTTTFGAFGIVIGVGNDHKIYHNSINLYGNSIAASTNAIANIGIASNTQTGLDIRNNVLANTVTGGSAQDVHVNLFMPFTALASMNLTLNNNAYFNGTITGKSGIAFSGGTAYGSGFVYETTNFNPTATTPAVNFRSFSSLLGVTSNDFASFASTSAAPFTSNTDLHIPNATSTQIESGGASLGVTSDIDGQTRPGSSGFPDMGADEFTGVLQDVTPPFISYTPLLSICSTTTQSLVATITDASGVPTAGTGRPVLYWRVNAGAFTAVTGTFIGSGQYQFNFGGGALGDVITYYIVAQDNAATPNIIASPSAGAGSYTSSPPAAGTIPTTLESYTIQNTLNAGTYTVGAGQNYSTLTEAINAYNNSCLNGAVIFVLTDASYSLSETFPISINYNSQASAINTLTIKPNTGVNSVISAPLSWAASAAIKLNGARYITIDGSNNASTSRNLIIENLNTATASAAVWIASTSTVGAINNTIKNIEARGASTTSTLGSIVVSGSVITSNAEVANSNLVLTNNSLYKARHGIIVSGKSGGQTITITDNSIGHATSSESISWRGISLTNISNSAVSNNTIFNLNSNVTAQSNPTGIYISSNVLSTVFDRNTIKDIAWTGSGGYGGKGFDINTRSTSSNLTISNNMISNIKGDGWNNLRSDAIIGIRIGATGGTNTSTGGIKVYHNSINLTGSFAGSSSGSQSAALFISASATSIDVRNNIFFTSLDNSTITTDKTWAINSAGTSSGFSAIDYNDYAVSGTPGILGFIASDRTTLAAIQSGFGSNVNSVNVTPAFTSATDLHLVPSTNGLLNDLGTAGLGITVDIDNTTRSVTTPDMGADEFTPPNCSGTPTGGTAVTTGSALCNSGSSTITSSGYTQGLGISYQWQSSPDNSVWSNITGEDDPASVSTGNITSTMYYRLRVTCSFGGAIGYSNVITITVNKPMLGVTTPGSRCGIGTVTLSAVLNSGNVVNWYAASTGGSALGTGTSFTTPSINATTTYYAAAAVTGASFNVGTVSDLAANLASFTNYGMYFSTTNSVTINSIEVYPSNAGTLTIQLRDQTNAVINSTNFTIAAGDVSTTVKKTLTLNFAIPAGVSGYSLYYTGLNIYRGGASSYTYPATNNGFSITGNTLNGNNISSGNRWYFYNWNVTASCESNRTAVIATVNTPPSATASASPVTICDGTSTSISASSANTGYTYTWANGVGTGSPITVSPTSTTTYTVTATDASGGPNNGCITTSSVTVTVNPSPTAVSIAPVTVDKCPSSAPVALTASGGTSTGETILTENFNGTAGGWTTLNNSTGGIPANAAWTLRSNGYVYGTNTFNSNDASQFYMSNSDDQGSAGTTNTILVSPTINLTGYTAASMTFYHNYRHVTGDQAYVELSTDGGSTWPTQLQTYTSTQGVSNGFVLVTTNLTPYIGNATVKIRFRYTATFGYWWAIDNINITGDQTSGITWSPNTGLYTDAAGTAAYTGTAAATVYANPATTTTYTATATNGIGCTRTSTRTVTVRDNAAVISGTAGICSGASTPITITFSGSGTWNVTYTNGTTPVTVNNIATSPYTFNVSPTTTTTYSLISVSNQYGCSGTISGSAVITVTPGPTSNAGPDTDVCQSSTPSAITLTGSSVGGGATTGAWSILSGGSGTLSSIAQTANPSAVTYTPAAGFTGTITLQLLTNAPGACPAVFDTRVINVNPLPANKTLTASPASICAGSASMIQVALSGVGVNYQLRNDAGDVNIGTPVAGTGGTINLPTGALAATTTFNVLATNATTGCSFELTPTITVTVTSLPASVSLAADINPYCAGGSVTLTATPTNGGTPTYQFFVNTISVQNGTSATYTYTPNSGDQVYVVMTSTLSCATGSPATSNMVTLTSKSAPTVTNAANCTTILSGSGQQATFTASATPGSGATITTYQWMLNGTTPVGTNSATYMTSTAGSYTVIVTNSNNCSVTSNAVVLTAATTALAGAYTIPSTGCTGFATIAQAVTYLNSYGVSAAVTFNITAGYNETAPAGGYVIGNTGSVILTGGNSTSAVRTVTFNGNNNIITASNALTAGSLTDALFKLIGADYITIKGFTLQENALNTTTTAASNNMTEWGVALLYVSTTDGAQNNIIQGNTIDLVRTYQNTFGVYANATHTATAVSASVTATGTAGGNSGLKIYGNTITDVNNGILIVGPTAAADHNDGIEIGGSLANANTISNYGSTGTFSNYVNVSGSIYGILVRNTKNYTISYNSITSSGLNTAGVVRGIYLPGFSNAPTGTIANTISNNTLSISNSAAAAITAIDHESAAGNSTTTNTFSSNIISSMNSTTGTPSMIGFNIAGTNTSNITGNTIQNLSGLGSVNGLQLTATTVNATGNTIHTLSSSTGTASLNGILVAASSATYNVFKNKIYNISATGVSTISGLVNGILYVSGGTLTAHTFNNYIGDLRAPNANNADAIRGIALTGTGVTTNYNVYFNTVHLNASSSGTAFGSSALYATTSSTATTVALTINNNIFVNASTPNGTGITAAYRRSSATLTNYVSTSNNNLFYAGTPGASRLLFYDGTNSSQTISQLQGITGMSPRESASISESPNFLSTTGSNANYLHIDPSIPTGIESGGIPISGITDDFDGDTRNSTPDIGADEFAGTSLGAFYYRTVSSGNWSTPGIWESSLDNVSWSTAPASPTSGSKTITVRTGHTVIINSNLNLDETIIEGTVDFQNGLLVLSNGTGADLTINNGGIFQISTAGAFGTAFTVSTSASLTVNSGAKITVGTGSGTVGTGYEALATSPDNTWNNNSVFEWNSDQTFGANGFTYFPNANTSTIPVFRVSRVQNLGIGGAGVTTINGLLEVNSPFSFTGAGAKNFRDGIIGTSTLTLDAANGTVTFTGTSPILGGTSLTLATAKQLNLTSGITVPAGANVLVTTSAANAFSKGTGGVFLVNGTLDITTVTITNTSGSVQVSSTGWLKTGATGGLYGASATVASGTLILGSGSTIEYNAAGNQAVQGLTVPAYSNIILSTSGTKTLASTNAIAAGTVTIKDAAIFDINSFTFGTGATNLTMSGTSRLINGGAGVKPDMGGTYSLGTGTTIEFNGTSATNIRIASPAPNYYNVVVSGTNVSTSSATVGMNFQAGGSFTVNNGATFKVTNTAGLAGGAATSVTSTNNPTVSLLTGSTIDYWGAAQTITNTVPYHHFTISGTGNKTAPTGTLTINGNITQSNSTSTFVHNSGTVVLSGSTTQTYSSVASAGFTFWNLTNNNTVGVNFDDSLAVNAELLLGANSKTNVNDPFVLKSTATRTANVAAVPTTASITYGSTGKFFVERYISMAFNGTSRYRKWHLLSIPTNTSQSIKDAWQEGATASTQDPVPGYGMQITDNKANWATQGFDAQSLGGPSVKTFAPEVGATPDTWNGINSTSNSIKTDAGYICYIRGDRLSLSSNSVTNATTLRTKGSIYTGNVSVNINPNKFQVVGNPYASAIDLRTITKNAVVPDIYIWDPYLGGSFGLGGYRTLAWDVATSAYYPVPSGGTGPYSGTTYNYLNSGLAFFTKGAGAGTGTILFKESDKTSVSDLATFSGGQFQSLRINLHSPTNTDNTLMDGSMVMFNEGFVNGIDFNDAEKLGNTNVNAGLKRNGKLLAIERRKNIRNNDTLYLSMTGLRVQSYNWEINPINIDNPARKAWLVDNYLKTRTELSLSAENNVSFSVENIAESYAADRFYIIFKQGNSGFAPISIHAQQANDGNIKVEWKAENEATFVKYEVERSVNNVQFTSVNNRNAGSQIVGEDGYSFQDMRITPADIYYRIKGQTTSGENIYSAVAKVEAVKTSYSISVYPNPVKDHNLQLRFQGQERGNYQLSLTNANGQVVYTNNLFIDGADQLKKLKLENTLGSGIYQLHITNPAGKKTVTQVMLD